MNENNLDLRNIRLVSWDVDGTLFSYLSLALALIEITCHAVQSGGWFKTRRELREIFEFHRMVERQRRNPNCGVLCEQLEGAKWAQAHEREALELALRKIQPRQSAVTLLEHFDACGTFQVALSDFECQYKLEALGVSHHFQKAYSCQQIGFWKPSPVPLANIQKDFGVRPEQHLHIGDRRDADGEACIRNGCHFLLVNRLPGLHLVAARSAAERSRRDHRIIAQHF